MVENKGSVNNSTHTVVRVMTEISYCLSCFHRRARIISSFLVDWFVCSEFNGIEEQGKRMLAQETVDL